MSSLILVAGLAAAVPVGLSACGQKGDLVLPPEKAAEAARLAQPRPAARASVALPPGAATGPASAPRLP